MKNKGGLIVDYGLVGGVYFLKQVECMLALIFNRLKTDSMHDV